MSVSNLQIHPPDTSREDAYRRVGRLVDKGGSTIGTCFRISPSNHILTARHCIEEHGSVLEGLSAFDHPLKFIAAWPDLDVALFQGPSNEGSVSHFMLAYAAKWIEPGTPVELMSYPEAMDKEGNLCEIRPSCTSGQVSGCDAAGKVASADFSGGPFTSFLF
jgi:hypothetical protein